MNLEEFLQLHVILNHYDISLAVIGNVLANASTVGSIDTTRQTTAVEG